MPKWLLVFITGSCAAVGGFCLGAVCFRYTRDTPARYASAVAIANTSTPEPTRHAANGVACILDMNKPEAIAYLASKNIHIKKDHYSNTDDFTMFSAPADIIFRINWRRAGGDYAIDQVFLGNMSIKHSPAGAEPVLATWQAVFPEIAELFAEPETDTRQGKLASPLRWYANGPYAYGVAQNNKYFIEYIGPQSDIPRLRSQSLDCLKMYLNWHNCVKVSQRCKRRLKIAAVGGRKPRHRGCYVSHPVWDVNSIIVSTV